MAKSLQEYIGWLDGQERIWPRPPAREPVNATPYLKPLAGIRAVTWSVYGTLLRISDGRLQFDDPLELRMQVAFDKTIREFNMWHSMTRKPGEPWKQMYEQYKTLLEQKQMAATKHKGDTIEVDVREIWSTIVKRLEAKEYTYDRGLYGDEDELAEKIAYFFHANLQGVEAAPHALTTLSAIAQSGIWQTVLDDGQSFTLAQTLRALGEQGTLPAPGDLFSFECLTLSFQEGVRKPSPTLFRNCLARLGRAGIAPEETVHVSSRLRDDLAVAGKLGMRTVLSAADKNGFQATREEVQNAELRPDRLITDLNQLREILQVG